MKILLILIACCLLVACQSTPITTAPSKPYTTRGELTIASTDPANDLVIVGRLVSLQKTPDCGSIHFSAVAEYTDLQVISGTYPYDTVYVMHGCPELKRSEYAKGSGDLGSFTVGDYHELHLTKENVYLTMDYSNGSYPKDRLYFCREVNLYRREPTVTPKSEHPVGEALGGVYLVGWGSIDRMYDIGALNLKDGLYSFTPLIPIEQIPQVAIDRLFFVKSPEGHYSLKYQDTINESTLLEDLDDATFLALISLTPRGTDETVTGSRQWGDVFFIATFKTKSLGFQSPYNEFQLWGIGKSWD